MNIQDTQQYKNTAGKLVHELVSANAQKYPAARAVDDLSTQLSWRELEELSNQVANSLCSQGLHSGDTVAIMASNSAYYVCVYVGILKAGGVVAPLSEFLDSRSLLAILKDCKPTFLFASKFNFDVIDGLRKNFKNLPVQTWVSLDEKNEGWEPLNDFLQLSSSMAPQHNIQANSMSTLVYSSGTTGLPKGISHSHAVRAMLGANFASVGFTPSTKTLLATPMCSNWTLTGLLPTLWAGGCTIIMPSFSHTQFLEICEKEQPDFTFLVPQQFYRVLDDPKFDTYLLGDNLAKFCAGAPMSVARKQEVINRWPGGFIEIYGLTESAITTSLILKDFPDKIASVGAPTEGVSVRILDDNDTVLPVGEAGEIVGRSPYVMMGYHNLEEATESLLWNDENGITYMRTGDVGYLDEDGFLYIVDRKKDMIISGGLNVYPSDIEQVLNSHPDVTESAVVPFANEKWGETPYAFITMKEQSATLPEDIKSWANNQLSKHQKVCGISVVDTFPRGSLDKILKKELVKKIKEPVAA